MTPATDRPAAVLSHDARIVSLVCAAHFVSHYYIMLLPPLFPLIRADFGVSYTQLGLALTAFNVLTAILQTPAGFLADRISPRAVLIGGLMIGSAALVGAAMLPWFWAFVVMFALLGVGNAVYHPADYALLSRSVSPARMGQAFSVHTFSGMAGSAVAPIGLLFIAGTMGWRGAYLASAAVGLVVAALLLIFGGEPRRADAKPAPEEQPAPVGWSVLLSGPILMNLLFFTLLALSNGGFQNYSVVVLDALYGIPLETANIALTSYLVMSAIGVLLGGLVASRTARHGVVAALGLSTATLALLVVTVQRVDAIALVTLFGLAGLATGLIMPSRDLLVRSVTPPGASGRVFGFVTTGFNIGGMIAPLAFGWLLDHGQPRGVLIATILFTLAAVPAALANGGRKRAVNAS